MKQLLFCYKDIYKETIDEDVLDKYRIKIRKSILTDVFVPIQDVVSPQKTTLTIPKTDKIQINDYIIIRDNESGEIEYIGYIDTLTNNNATEISCYPLINAFDNDFVLDQMFTSGTNLDGTETDIAVNAIEWLKKQITRAFIVEPENPSSEYEYTDDLYQCLPLIIRNYSRGAVLQKKVIDTSNLFEAYTDLFNEKGVYVKFSGLRYNKNLIEGIYCDIYCNTDEKAYYLRYDNPNIQSVTIVDNTFTNYNKIIATEEIEELSDDATDEEIAHHNERIKNRQRFYFYLLKDNGITTDVNHSDRIKQVRSKEITFKNETELTEEEAEGKTDAEKQALLAEKNAKSLLLTIFNELQSPEYNLQITITMLKNDNIRLHRRVEFVSDKTYIEDGTVKNVIYTSNITRIEILNDKQVKIVLGALRNSLTDFKKKVEAI